MGITSALATPLPGASPELKVFQPALSAGKGPTQSGPAKASKSNGNVVMGKFTKPVRKSMRRRCLQQLGSTKPIGRANSSAERRVFSGSHDWKLTLSYIRPVGVAFASEGDVVSYRMKVALSPLNLYRQVCDGGKGDDLVTFEYVHFFRETEMCFSLTQVERILLDRHDWKNQLNLDGTANVFHVLHGKKVFIVIARWINERWEIKDSRPGLGRGYDPGANFLFRNKSHL